MRRTITTAKNRLKTLQEDHRSLEESLIQTFGQILHVANDEKTNADLGDDVKNILQKQGGVALLKQQYEAASSYHQNNYRPLLWQFHKKHRTVLFRILDLFQLHSATQDKSLLTAFEYVCKNRHTRRDWLTYDIDLGFASQKWQQLIIKKQGQEKWLDRRMLEVCVFVHLADELGCANFISMGQRVMVIRMNSF